MIKFKSAIAAMVCAITLIGTACSIGDNSNDNDSEITLAEKEYTDSTIVFRMPADVKLVSPGNPNDSFQFSRKEDDNTMTEYDIWGDDFDGEYNIDSFKNFTSSTIDEAETNMTGQTFELLSTKSKKTGNAEQFRSDVKITDTNGDESHMAIITIFSPADKATASVIVIHDADNKKAAREAEAIAASVKFVK